MAAQEERETVAKLAKVNPVKLTQSKIRDETEKRAQAAKAASTKPEPDTHLSKPLEENINR